MTDAQLKHSLDDSLSKLGGAFPSGTAGALQEFLRLLEKWNRAWNLTAVRNPLEMVSRHVLDSLSIRPWLRGERLADVGSGAGLPGIPLAIAEPARRFVLIDSAAKRCRFMTHAAVTLGLGNVEVVHSRAQDYHPDSGFDTVISRAFASLAEFTLAAGHLCVPGGHLLAMKGRLPEDEIARLPSDWRVARAESLTVPGITAARHVVLLQAAGADDRQ